ncbi:FecR family protein [Novosphingobium umbonatum]|uniref:FecR family protein n=1 Tax=Novosphingobium umbonatum TaxID=1908524 RepID=UPI0013E3FA76|nr:FecR domain-containing protein [Novosphingobium umbonatum]
MTKPMAEDEPGGPDAEAAVWLARLHGDDCSAADEEGFRRWISADSANRDAFEHLTEAWELAGSARRSPYRIDLEQARPAGVSRRRVVCGALAALTLAGGMGYWQVALAGVYQTDLGEQKTVTLHDGTLVVLDTATKIRVRYSDARRSLELVHGRCSVNVAPDATRLFDVTAANNTIITSHADIDIRADHGRIQVLCIAGKALVATSGATIPRASLVAGQRLVAGEHLAARIDEPDVDAERSWKAGQLNFDGEALMDAVEEMNRYSTVKLVIADPQIAQLQISGVYRAGDNLAFAQSIQKILPVTVTVQSEKIQIHSAA